MTYSEQIEQAKNVNLLEVVKHFGHTIQRVGHYHTVRDMDSVRIYNERSWTRFSNGSGGDTIAWLTEIEGYGFKEAVSYLMEFSGYHPEAVQPEQNKGFETPPVKEFQLPAKAKYQSRLYAYLSGQRGIDRNIIKYFERLGLIYISQRFLNVVFVGTDASGQPRHAAMRSTDAAHPYKGDALGSNKSYGFNLYRESDTVVVTEAAIDLLSYLHLSGDMTSSLLSMGGTADNPLERYLTEHPGIKKIHLLLDADDAGSTAVSRLAKKYQKKGFVVQDIRPAVLWEWNCKDMNELLLQTANHPEYQPGMFFQKAAQSVAEPEEVPVQKAAQSVDESVQVQPQEEVRSICLEALYRIYEKMHEMEASGTEDTKAWEDVVLAGGALYNLAISRGWQPKDWGQEREKKESPQIRSPDEERHRAVRRSSRQL